jgi:hypothetical protein
MYACVLKEFLFSCWTGGTGGVGFTPHVITVKAGEVCICAAF